MLIKFHSFNNWNHGKTREKKLIMYKSWFLSWGTLPSLKHEQSGWRQHTKSKEISFALNVCWVAMPLYDSCVVYTLTKPWQMLVSFPFKKVVIWEQQVWWFFFSSSLLIL